MALKATIYKAELAIADLDRHYYGDHTLTLAQHPSETDERLMVRLLAFAWHADERLEFTRGLSSDDEPDLWLRDLTGEIQSWIEVGLPDERRLRKACGRARQVIVYAYGVRSAAIWREQQEKSWARLDNLTIYYLPATEELTQLAARNLRLSCTVQEGACFLNDGAANVEVGREIWHGGV
jgi:uncharacterized protein YaeQ